MMLQSWRRTRAWITQQCFFGRDSPLLAHPGLYAAAVNEEVAVRAMRGKPAPPREVSRGTGELSCHDRPELPYKCFRLNSSLKW